MRRLLLALAVSACSVAPLADHAEAIAVEVIDGDSLVVQTAGEEIELRLQGINAPERDECMGPESADALARFTATGTFSFETTGTDQFGRSLGDVFVNGRSAAESQVAAGMALAISDGGGRLFGSQEAALAAGIGMWSEQACGTTGPRPPVELADLVADPPGPDGDSIDSETVTLRNTGEETVDLNGWVLRDESSANRYRFGPGSALAPGATVVVSSGCGGDPSVVYWCSDSPVWNNGGDTALLLDDRGRVVSVLRHEP